MVSACLEAHRVTGDAYWVEKAGVVFEWFLGRNDLGIALYDPLTGACRDGLHTNRVNQKPGRGIHVGVPALAQRNASGTGADGGSRTGHRRSGGGVISDFRATGPVAA